MSVSFAEIRFTAFFEPLNFGRLNGVHQTATDTQFLPLDEAIASRAVFVIMSGSDVRAETLFEPAMLGNSKTVADRPYVSMGS